MDMLNHDHNNDTGLYLINKELHIEPMQAKSYFSSDKYLNDVSMLYQKDTEPDR